MKIHKTTPMTCVLFCTLYFNKKLIRKKFRCKAQAWQVTKDSFLSLLLEKGLALQSPFPWPWQGLREPRGRGGM